MAESVKVLVVDDSAYMRVVLKDILDSEPGLLVVDTARDGFDAIEKVKRLSPDVVLLDIQMPKMDGIATLQRIMRERPTRVVMLSAMDKVDDQLPLRALECGAVDFISKPSGPVSIDIVMFKTRIAEIVRNASMARLDALTRMRGAQPQKLHLTTTRRVPPTGARAVLIAASTGGPRALESIFATLPRTVDVPLFVVQHIPEEFSISFVKRLNSARGPKVVLAEDGMEVTSDRAYLAPGGRHMRLNRGDGARLVIKLDDGEPVRFVRPSADVLFKSAVEVLHGNILAVVLTGMGSDGADGALAVKRAGGRVVVQDEETSVIFGMARAAIDLEAADKALPLEEIPKEILRYMEE